MADFSTDNEGPQGLKERLTKERSLRHLSLFEELLRLFSPGERLLLYALTALFAISALALVAGANAAVSVTVPSAGGTLVEGEVGPMRFANPLLTLSRADEDITALVYSGLMRALPDGSLVPDLAERYQISDDGLTYTFTLRDGLTFHDGTPLTSADILFTVATAQNPEMKSAHRADWEGVSVSAPDPRTVVFQLPRVYAPFLHNTTMGILPEHLWKNVTAEEFPFSPLNTHPVGSGPYALSRLDEDSTGSVTRIELEPFEEFALGAPFLRKIAFVFYANEEEMVGAYESGRIDAIAGISPESLLGLELSDAKVLTVALPRVFGVFFNQNRAPVLTDAAARAALDAAVDKESLVASVLHGYGAPLSGPLPPSVSSASDSARIPSETSLAYTESTLAEARDILERGGWKFDESTGQWTKQKRALTLTLSTADAPELKASADAVAAAWRELGVGVTVQVYSLSELNSSVIRPREYDALLFGEVVGRELDLFAFWHSSQRNDPGLNLALYANARADSFLTDARATTDASERESLYREFAELVASEHPAVFLYAPEFIYVVPQDLQGVSLAPLASPGERFLNAYQWYADTESVWSFFAREGDIIL